MDTRSRIFELLDSANMEQKELANILGLPADTVSSWRRKKSASYTKYLPQIAEVLGTTTEYLLTGSSPASVGAVRVPVLGVIPAGIPIEAVEDVQGWEEIPAEWIAGGREYFGLKVQGDSMYPKYLHGDTVLLLKQDTCESGDDCAVFVDGESATLKQVHFHPDGSLELRPLNPSYAPRTYTAREVEELPIRIVGVVVELRRKIK